MNIKNMLAFLRVCQEGGIRKAADSLYISPQGLSKLIQTLENGLGVPLFYRSAGRLVVSEYGEIFKPYVEKMIENTKEMEAKIEKARNQNKGVVSISLSLGVAEAIFQDHLLELKTMNPDLQFDIHETIDKEVQRQVQAEEAGIGLTLNPIDSQDFQVDFIKSFNLVLMVHENHPLAEKDFVSAEDLRNQDLILFNFNFMIHHYVSAACLNAGFAPNIVYPISEAVTAFTLCAHGKGVAVLVDYLAYKLALPGIVVLPFTDGFCTWDVVLLTKKGTALSDPAKFIHSYLLETFS